MTTLFKHRYNLSVFEYSFANCRKPKSYLLGHSSPRTNPNTLIARLTSIHAFFPSQVLMDFAIPKDLVASITLTGTVFKEILCLAQLNK